MWSQGKQTETASFVFPPPPPPGAITKSQGHGILRPLLYKQGVQVFIYYRHWRLDVEPLSQYPPVWLHLSSATSILMKTLYKHSTNAAKCTSDRNKRKMGHFSSCSLPYLQWNLDITNLYNEVLYTMNECVQNYLGYKLYLVKN